MQTQGSIAKKFKPKESRPMETKPANGKSSALPCSNEAVKPNCHEKKKEYQKKKQDQKNSSPAIRDNAIKGNNKKKKGNKKYYNCLKKGHFAQKLLKTSKRLVLVLTTSVPVTNGSEEVVQVPCIYYSVQFQEHQVKALLNSNNEVNTINLNYIWNLGLKIPRINVEAQKIDGSVLETFGIVIADFQIENKANKLRFFQEIFLVTNTKFEVILKMPFMKISNADILFSENTLT